MPQPSVTVGGFLASHPEAAGLPLDNAVDWQVWFAPAENGAVLMKESVRAVLEVVPGIYDWRPLLLPSDAFFRARRCERPCPRRAGETRPRRRSEKDEMGCRAQHRLAKLGREVGCDAPRRKELGVREYAASQVRDPQDV